MKRCWFCLLITSSCLVSLSSTADESTKTAPSSIVASSEKHHSASEHMITNEADYAELVRARESQQKTSAKSSSKSSQASSKASKN